MSVITRVSEPNLWDEICKEFRHREHPKDEDQMSVATDYSDFDAARHNPVFYGRMHAKVSTDGDVEFDPSIGHPACIGYAFTDKPPKPPTPPGPPPPDKKKCPPRQYLEYYVFPYLLPALEAMLKQAKIEKCFERKRTKFNALDFITEYLYRRNPNYSDRGTTELWDIPFVKEWLKDHPRPPLPLSLLWTEEEAALIIQSHWRGYLVRREPEVQELRQWQREWREINGNIHSRVSDFWDSKMADESRATGTPTASVLSTNYRPASPIPDSTTPTSGFVTAPPSRISVPSELGPLTETSATEGQ
ncbi:IQ domain-containing protein K-like [Babylonia areolata]|uniref:IQ domain-containing protein K-like n=1 Tax=Babylonia areolata TaxID=304850 RepID=UPI003FD550B1